MGASGKGCTFCKVCGFCCCFIMVVLAVMIPVGILVIAPKMSQQTLNGGDVLITNGTMYELPSGPALVNGVVGKIFNNGTMSANFPVPIPGGATVEPFNATMWAPDPGCAFSYPPRDCSHSGEEVAIAQFTFPEIKVNDGINPAVFTADLTVLNATYVTDFGLAVSLCQRWDKCIGTYNISQMNVTLRGSPTLKVLGFIKMKNLKLEKSLNCIHLPAPPKPATLAIEEDAEQLDVIEKRRLGGMLTVNMECRMAGSDALAQPTLAPPATTAAPIDV